MYSNKITINLFCDREWSWHLPGDLIAINGWSRQALCGVSSLSDTECQLPPEYLWLYSHHLTFSFSNITTKRLLPTLYHRMNRPFCGHVQTKNWGRNAHVTWISAQRSRPTFVGWQHWPTYICHMSSAQAGFTMSCECWLIQCHHHICSEQPASHDTGNNNSIGAASSANTDPAVLIITKKNCRNLQKTADNLPKTR